MHETQSDVNTILLAIAWYAHIAARHRRRILNVVLQVCLLLCFTRSFISFPLSITFSILPHLSLSVHVLSLTRSLSRSLANLCVSSNQLGKWSLVDVFSVMVLVAGLNFTVMGGAYQTIAVAGPAIYTFGASVILHHIQAEWMIGVDRAEEKRNKELAGGAEITATPGASENGDGSEAATDEAAAGSPAGAEQLAPRRLSDAEKGTMTTGGEVVGGVPVVTSSGGAMQQTTSSDSTSTPSSPSCYESSVSWQMVAATTVPALVLTVAGLAGPAISLGIGENGCPPEIRSYSLLTLGSATPMSAADGADGGAFLLPLYYCESMLVCGVQDLCPGVALPRPLNPEY